LSLPPGFHWEEQLTEDAAVTLALWNNAAFHEVLTGLGLARADEVQAGQLPNPELWLLTPLGVKQLEYAVEFPVEALWLRPQRVAVAQRESERVAAALVQSGLNLIRDVRAAYADVLLAEDRVQIARDAERLRRRIAELAEARLKAGDAGPVEVATARIDALRATQEAARLEDDVELARERLRNLMGVGATHPSLKLCEPPLPVINLDAATLVADALAARPDLAAAAHAVAVAEARLRLARCDWVRFLGISDANGRGQKGYEQGPGFRVTLPLFNWNQGGIARAEAERERVARQYDTLRDRIMLEVRQAQVQLAQARADLTRWQTRIRPAVEKAIGAAERAYKEGDTNLVLVLETTRQLLDAQGREAQLRADVRRAIAELERSVGYRLTSPDIATWREIP
jgi:cobalt-zinc-cadmium efflux system outer membrane protein